QLLLLEKDPTNLQIVAEIFRAAHTLKGMSATMGFNDLAELTHKMENVLDEVRTQRIHVTSNMLDVVFEAVEHLEIMIDDIANGGDGKRDVQDVVQKLFKISKGIEIEPVSEQNQQQSTALEKNNTSVEQNDHFDELDE